MAKKYKLFVFQNVAGTKRRADKASPIIGAFLLQHVKGWMDSLNALNDHKFKEAQKTGRKMWKHELTLPVQDIPEKTYDMIVKELKPLESGNFTKGERKFDLHCSFPNGSHPMVTIRRVTQEQFDKNNPSKVEQVKEQPEKKTGVKKKGENGLTKAVEQIEAEKIEARKERAKVNRKKLKDKRSKEALELKGSSRGNVLVDQADIETADIEVVGQGKV